jgi:hypothetical protein
MSWNAPQTLTEAINSVEAGWSFQSHLGVKGEPIWVLTDITRDFPNATGEFADDLIRRNREQRERYLGTPGRRDLPEDVVYVVARDSVLLVGLLRDGTLLVNESADLPRKLTTFRDHAVSALTQHVTRRGHLTRSEH